MLMAQRTEKCLLKDPSAASKFNEQFEDFDDNPNYNVAWPIPLYALYTVTSPYNALF